MALSKKHYEQFAYHFRNSIEKAKRDAGAGVSPLTTAYAITQLEQLARKMAVDFALDNPAFNRDRFLLACGF